MQDILIRGTAFDGKVRAFAVNTHVLVEELRKRHGTWPTATAALGRTATAGAILGAMLKGNEKLTIQVKGDGPIGQIVVDANAHGEVRGYVDNPQVHLPSNAQGKLDVAGAVGREGMLNITKDLGLKKPYCGGVPIVSGELGEDFTYYFAKSEQTPSVVALGVLVDIDHSVKAAGGFVIQLLPDCTNEEIIAIEQQLEQMPALTTLLDEGNNLEQILKRILPSIKIMEQMDINFRCKCSYERVEQTLMTLGKSEVEQILTEDKKAEIICHFCNEQYIFGEEQLEQLLEKINDPS